MNKITLILFSFFLVYGLSGQEMSINKLSDNESDLKFIYDLKVDVNGGLHIASDKGLFLYDGFGFNKLGLKYADENPFISAIEKGDSALLYANFEGKISSQERLIDLKYSMKVVAIVSGLYHTYVVGQKGQLQELNQDLVFNREYSIGTNLVVNDVQYKNGLIYIATTNGLYIYSSKKQELELKKHIFQGENIKVVFADKRIFVATEKQVRHISLIVGELVELDLSPLLKGDIKSILVDDTRLVVGTSRGIYDLYITGPNYFLSAKKEFEDDSEFSVSKLCYGPDKSIYVGTKGNGLWGISSPTFYYLPDEILQNSDINCIDRFSENIFMFGGKKGVSFYLNGKNVSDDFEELNSLKESEINTFQKTKKGVYIGTENDGVWLLAPDKSLKQLTNNIRSIQDIEADSIGNLWISTAYEGLFVYSNQQVIHFSDKKMFNRNDLSKILWNKGKLWFINGDEGVAYVDLKDSTVHTPKYFPSIKMLDFDINSSGEFFAATENEGIIYVKNEQVSFIDIKKVTNSNQCFSIITDDGGGFWFSNQKALFYWSPTAGVVASLATEYFSSGFRQLSNYNLKSSKWLYYGTEGGVLYFDSQLGKNIKKVKFYSSINGINIVGGEVVNLSYSESIKLQFRYDDMVNNNHLNYYFKVDDRDTSWRKAEKNVIEYSNLGYGDFTVRIRALTEGGILFRQQAINLSINKPFWLQIWFYVILFLILSVTLYIIVQYRIKQLKLRNVQLTELVDLRTREITLKNKRLEQFAYAVSHDLKNPVINIIGLIDLLNEKDAIKDRESRKIFDMLTHSSSQLDRLVKGLVELLKVRNESVEISKVYVSKVLEEVKNAISLQILDSKAVFKEDIQVDEILYNHTYLYSIIYNLVSNAVKYRDPYRDLEISISTKKHKDFVALEIEDTGLGMDLDENRDKLFKMFQRFHDHVEGTGVGLHLIKEMVENSGGYIEVESQLRIGTKFTIFLKES